MNKLAPLRNSLKTNLLGLLTLASGALILNNFHNSHLFILADSGAQFVQSRLPTNLLYSGFPGPEISNIPSSYKSLAEIESEIQSLKRAYPALVHIERLGSSTTLGLPIWGVKISDNAATREDEPRILFTGVHHAREPIGANICLGLAGSLCRGYKNDQQIRKWLNSIEIWIVPVVNPDGYKYIFNNNLSFPWWRKNLRDNDGDGFFNPLYDGVDLNRNYDFNWHEGGDSRPGSWFYHGAYPFSEKETQAIMNLTIRENFAMGVSYHSYGESILFPWGNYQRPPDLDLIVDIASEMASRIKRQSGYGFYSILPLNGRVGQSSIWMYGHLKVLDFIVETGTDYFPDDDRVPVIVAENIQGACYLLERLLQSGLKGHVIDAHSQEVLTATITIKRYAANHVNPRRTEPVFGGFYRLLNPGKYTIQVESNGYKPRTFNGIKVHKNRITSLEIKLERKIGYTNGRRQ